MSRCFPIALTLPLPKAALCSALLGLLLAPAAHAETLFWPATGSLRECPEFLDMALYPDMHAGNTIIIQGDVPGDVAGAVAYAPLTPPRNAEEAQALASAQPRGNGTARRNTVLLQRGVVEGFVDGGWSAVGPARDNILIVSGGTVRKLARGGGSNGGPAEGNVLHMAGGRVDGSAIGGSSLHHAASGNTLTFSGGEVRDVVVGGSSNFGPAESNTVHMGGGRAASVVGGSSGQGNVQGNAVHVWGGEVTRDIVGGETAAGELTTQNTVVLGRHAQLAPEVRIFGGLKLDAAAEPTPLPAAPAQKAPSKKAAGRNEFLFKGNVLKVQWQGRVRGVHNFQYWEFFLPENVQPGATLLTVDEEVDLRQCVLRLVPNAVPAPPLPPSGAVASPLSALSSWRAGDSAVLVRAPALLTEGLSLPAATVTMRNAQGRPQRMEFTLALDNARTPTAVVLTLARVTALPKQP